MASPFGDVGTGENLQAADQRIQMFPTDRFVRQHHPVTAETNPHLIGHRLNMDVARLSRQAVSENAVSQRDRFTTTGLVLLVEQATLFAFERIDGVFDALFARQRQQHLMAVDPLGVIPHLLAHRVYGSNDHMPFVELHRHH